MGNIENEESFYDGEFIKTEKMKKNILMHSKKIKFYFLQEQNITYLNGIIKVN